ncbi:acyl carrier protein [Paenibacillus arenosi]|uniref:Acyl carrier protein n=1 Tax=Paenibacillus arenosi TaxID=2774142 RepID=A0ABR9AS57_9BACL|nr:acyl carrier protein [Paenibacillus arenosi]MBD8496934.1 acyl carrier protein [Paenibacillus arenosi]
MAEQMMQRLAKVIATKTENEEVLSRIRMDSSFDELGIHSVSFIKIMVGVEEEFGIEIENEELYMENESFSNVASLVQFVQLKLDRGEKLLG